MENMELRLKARAAGIPLWRIADHLQISEASLTRMLRHPVDTATRKRICEAIKTIKNNKMEGE